MSGQSIPTLRVCAVDISVVVALVKVGPSSAATDRGQPAAPLRLRRRVLPGKGVGSLRSVEEAFSTANDEQHDDRYVEG